MSFASTALVRPMRQGRIVTTLFLFLGWWGFLASAQSNPPFTLSWLSDAEWELSIHLGTPSEPHPPTDFLHLVYPLTELSVDPNALLAVLLAESWFNADGEAWGYVSLNAALNQLEFFLFRPAGNTLGGYGLVAQGSGTGVLIDDIQVRMKELEATFSVYVTPNGWLSLQFAPTIQGSVSLRQFDGKQLQAVSLPDGSETLKLSISGLPSGVYLVGLKSEGVEVCRKVVIR